MTDRTPQPPFSARDFIRLVFTYQRAARTAFLVTLVTVLVGIFVLPPRYASEAKLLVKPGRESTASVDVIDRPTIVPTNATRNPLVDEKAILGSRPVMNQVADTLQRYLDQQAEQGGWWKQTKRAIKSALGSVTDLIRDGFVLIGLTDRVEPRDQIVAGLEKALTATNEVGSAVLEVKLEWDDAGVAKAILTEWIDIYLKTRIESLSGRDSYAFYEKQLAQWQGQLAELSGELEALHQTLGAVNLEERERKLRDRIQGLETQNDNLRVEESAVKASLASTRSVASSIPDLTVNERVSKESEAVTNLRMRLNDALVQREVLLRTYEASAPPVIDIEQTIANLRNLLAKEPANSTANETQRASKVKESVEQRLTDKHIRKDEIAASTRRSAAELADLRKELENIIGNEVREDKLKREIKLAEENVILYANKLEKVRIDQELDLKRISNVAVIEPPTLNAKRVFPKTIPILLAAPFVALLVSLAVVVILKLTELRVFDGWRIEERFGVPFLGSIPDRADANSDEYRAIRRINLAKLATRLSALGHNGVRTIGLVPLHNNDDCQSVADELKPLLAIHPHAPTLFVIPSLQATQESLLQPGAVDRLVLVGIAGETTLAVLGSEVRFIEGSFPGRLAGLFLHGQKFAIPPKLYKWFA